MIYTVTLNPALDKTAEIENFRPDSVNRIRALRTDPGGKGVNVSKVIAKLGGTSVAAAILGGGSGRLIADALAQLGIAGMFRFVPGETRTNLKIIDPVQHTHTDINEPGIPADAGVLAGLLEELTGRLAPGDLVVLSGSLPAGAPADTYCGSEGYWRLSDSVARPETFEVSSLDRSYTDVLPSFNLAYDLTEDLVLRGAASKVIARPSYSDIAAPGSLEYFSEEYVADRRLTGGAGQQGWYGSGSNKELDPYQATQYDVGLEWYFQPGSVVGLGLFRKDVSNFTVPVVADVEMVVNGETVTVQNYATEAGGRDAVSQGAELYAQHTLDFGLGFQFNYTYNDTNEAAITLEDGTELGESPLVGSAKNQTNFTVFYENDKLLLRASYNRRGEVVQGLVNGLNLYDEPYQQIDVNAAYNFTPEFSISASVLNLTEEETRTHLGNDTKDRFYSNGYAGRVAYLGLTYRF